MVKIYALKNPLTGQIFYVGASNDPVKRLYSHCWGHNRHPMNPMSKQMDSILAAKSMPEIIILDETEVEKVRELETHYIELYRSIGYPIKQGKSSYPRVFYPKYGSADFRIEDLKARNEKSHQEWLKQASPRQLANFAKYNKTMNF